MVDANRGRGARSKILRLLSSDFVNFEDPRDVLKCFITFCFSGGFVLGNYLDENYEL